MTPLAAGLRLKRTACRAWPANFCTLIPQCNRLSLCRAEKLALPRAVLHLQEMTYTVSHLALRLRAPSFSRRWSAALPRALPRAALHLQEMTYTVSHLAVSLSAHAISKR